MRSWYRPGPGEGSSVSNADYVSQGAEVLPDSTRYAGWEPGRSITVGGGARLGGGVIVLSGVTIRANAVIGAGSVVTRDVPPGAVAVGNPARLTTPA